MEKAFHARVLLLEPHLTSQECAALMSANGMSKEEPLIAAAAFNADTQEHQGTWIIQPIETH